MMSYVEPTFRSSIYLIKCDLESLEHDLNDQLDQFYTNLDHFYTNLDKFIDAFETSDEKKQMEKFVKNLKKKTNDAHEVIKFAVQAILEEEIEYLLECCRLDDLDMAEAINLLKDICTELAEVERDAASLFDQAKLYLKECPIPFPAIVFVSNVLHLVQDFTRSQCKVLNESIQYVILDHS